MSDATQARGAPIESCSLLWMHAMNRATPAELVAALRDGPRPPTSTGNTQQLELELEMKTRNVYAYLGRTLEAFGSTVIALSNNAALTAEASPFDTGGLVKHAKPVCDWPNAERNGYLQDFTWPGGEELETALTKYPGNNVAEYLNIDWRPRDKGPTSVWPERRASPKEASVHDEQPREDTLWSSENADWRCWTWEARWPEHLDTRDLVAWSCAPHLYPKVLNRIGELPIHRG
jgi:hypothetical protein